jgi:hypothetical protein
LVLLGRREEIEFLTAGFVAAGREVRGIHWDWDTQTDLTSIPKDAPTIICKLPKKWRFVPTIPRYKSEKHNHSTSKMI